jgi:myo-inositol 2-dehydrogenase / D-chiro-inositol 1-dehydrogenase
MTDTRLSRRAFLQGCSTTAAAGLLTPYFFTAGAAEADLAQSPNDRFRIGAIGMRYQGSVVAEKTLPHGDIVAICDVDRQIAEKAREQFGGQAELYEDYRAMLDRKDIEIITIGSPDHWHAAMLIDACRAGKDVYVEKPLSLTIDEGKAVRRVVQETGRVVQVGSWQRSDHRFRLAVEMVRQGRIGDLQRVDIVLGKNVVGGPFEVKQPPPHLNWDLWLGQTPAVPYIEERCHYTFRWWYEYSGGQMTDWGAHHLDIAQWAIGAQPLEVRGEATYPNTPNGYNVAVDYYAEYRYPGGVIMTVADHGRNGIMFTGTKGRIFVNRGSIEGKPVEDLVDAPLEREAFKIYAHDNLDRPARMGKLDSIVNHMGNFFDCVKTRNTPISDVVSQDQSTNTCHMGNIAMHVGRALRWDAQAEQFVGDDEANQLLRRAQRAGYEIS